jgi:hypothetical protein
MEFEIVFLVLLVLGAALSLLSGGKGHMPDSGCMTFGPPRMGCVIVFIIVLVVCTAIVQTP